MTKETLNGKATRLRDLHEGPILVLPNAWDAASAAIVARAGADAIATTSGGVSWAMGASDGQALPRDEMLSAIYRVAAAVAIPVTADVEAGYGDVAATIEGVLAAGAVGVNLEDSRDGQVIPAADQAREFETARQAAAAFGVPDLVINARTDIYLFRVGAEEDRFDDVIARGQAYAEAGADVLFVPGLLDLEVLARLTKACALPISVMTKPGGPTVAQLASAGVRRVSAGTGLAELAYGMTLRAAQELLQEGTLPEPVGGLEYGQINALFR